MPTVTSSCRSCGREELEAIMSLGRTPLANALLSSAQLDEPEPNYPLDLAFCRHCTQVQLTISVPPQQLFSEYVYFSSYSDEMLRHAERLAGEVITTERLNQRSLVVEVASNDGYLLQYYQAREIQVLGIEPAVNVAHVAREERGIPTLCEFFTVSLARQLTERGVRADVVHAHNVLAHVPDLNGFVAGIALLLNETGVAIVEVPYVRDLIDHVEFDTIYHEHLCYFSLTALKALFRRHGLELWDVQRIPTHGGSIRIFAGHQGRAIGARHSVAQMLSDEAEWGVHQAGRYEGFAAAVDRLRVNLLELLQQLKSAGNRIAAYGASAKGTTLLNYFGIGRDTLDFIVDRSPVKQGYYTPGTHLPIYAPEKLLADKPDYVLLLTWNCADEILAQQQEYRRGGGRFIVPIPHLRIV